MLSKRLGPSDWTEILSGGGKGVAAEKLVRLSCDMVMIRYLEEIKRNLNEKMGFDKVLRCVPKDGVSVRG